MPGVPPVAGLAPGSTSSPPGTRNLEASVALMAELHTCSSVIISIIIINIIIIVILSILPTVST